MPGGLPSNIRMQCVDHPEFESAGHADIYPHVRDAHDMVTPHWLWLADGVSAPPE